MKLIVAGTRDSTDYKTVKKYLSELHSETPITEVVSGGEKGPDRYGELWARAWGIPVTQFLPNYDRNPIKAAPVIRNSEMAKYADFLIAFWNGKSRSTKDMINKMKQKRKKVLIIPVY